MQLASNLPNYTRQTLSMKQHKQVKLLIINFLLIVFAACFSTNASAKNWSISVSPILGLHIGKLGEYVFNKNADGEYKKLSQLNWEIKPIFHYGGQLAIAWKWLSLSAYGQGCIPMRCGNMDDSDWLNLNSVKNIYSIHENSLASSYSFGGTFAYTFRPQDTFALQFFCGIDYECIAMEARNGYGWYGEGWNTAAVLEKGAWDGNGTKFYEKVAGIDYMRETVRTWLGCGMEMKFINNRLSLTLSFSLSPYLYVQSLDHHYGNNKQHYNIDIIHGVLSAYKPRALVVFNFNKNFSIFLDASWIFSQIVQGKTYRALSVNTWNLLAAKGGASFNYADISLGGTYRFAF